MNDVQHMPIKHSRPTNALEVNSDPPSTSVEGEAEIILGMEAGELDIEHEHEFKVELSTLIISALIFLGVLAWFDFMQTGLFDWLSPSTQVNEVPSSVKFWYAILVTVVVVVLVILLYYHFHSKSNNKKKGKKK